VSVAVRTTNEADDPASAFLQSGDAVTYKSVVTGEALTFGDPGRPLLAIDGNSDAAQAETFEAVAKDTPLITVRQVDEHFGFTDAYYVHTPDTGLIEVCNPALGQRLTIDGRDPQNPQSTLVPATQCRGRFPIDFEETEWGA
jgi:hypothetical protein